MKKSCHRRKHGYESLPVQQFLSGVAATSTVIETLRLLHVSPAGEFVGARPKLAWDSAGTSISGQHPPQDAPHLHWPFAQLQLPLQHSNFGRLTGWALTKLEPTSRGSNWTPLPTRRRAGGGGNVAARAKKRLREALLLMKSREGADDAEVGGMDENGEVLIGRVMPDWLSTHVPHCPSVQSCNSFAAYAEPRCSTHPGHEHLTPHVHPEPASDVIVLIGGMNPKSGTWLGRIGDNSLEVWIGGSSRTGEVLHWWLSWHFDRSCESWWRLEDWALLCLDESEGLVGFTLDRAICAGSSREFDANDGDSTYEVLQQLIVAACARIARSPEDSELDLSVERSACWQLHFQTLLHGHGFRRASTRLDINDMNRLGDIDSEDTSLSSVWERTRYLCCGKYISESIRQSRNNWYESASCKAGHELRISRPEAIDNCVHFDVVDARTSPRFAESGFGLQVHLEWIFFDCRSSLHFSHWDTGRPFFLISKSGLSLWWQDEDRWPLMHDSLYETAWKAAREHKCNQWHLPSEFLAIDIDLETRG